MYGVDFVGPREEPSAFDVFNNAIAQGTQSVVSLVNSRNQVRDALAGTQRPAPQTAGGSAETKSGGVPSWVLFAVLGIVLVKVLK